MTELILIKKLNISKKSWENIKKGIRRPSHTLVNELAILLGDEIRLLFTGYYITDSTPKLTLASEFIQDKITKKSQENIKEMKKLKKKFVYLNY